MPIRNSLKSKYAIFLNEKIILILLFLFSFILRMLLKADCIFHGDSLSNMDYLMSNTVGGDASKGVVHPFILSLSHKVLSLFNSNPENTVILTPIIIASFSIIIFYLFVKEISNNKFVSIVSSLLFSCEKSHQLFAYLVYKHLRNNVIYL